MPIRLRPASKRLGLISQSPMISTRLPCRFRSSRPHVPEPRLPVPTIATRVFFDWVCDAAPKPAAAATRKPLRGSVLAGIVLFSYEIGVIVDLNLLFLATIPQI
jgi:hypothetical protein